MSTYTPTKEELIELGFEVTEKITKDKTTLTAEMEFIHKVLPVRRLTLEFGDGKFALSTIPVKFKSKEYLASFINTFKITN